MRMEKEWNGKAEGNARPWSRRTSEDVILPAHSLKAFGSLPLAMSKRFCKYPNEHCFDRAIQCGSCDPGDLDSEGYPSNTRRRLTNEDADGMVVDIDTKQKFKVTKVKGGKRLVPQFKRMDWKSARGFAAMCLLLSLLGAEGEYVLWDENTNAEMTENEWRRRNFQARSKPPIRHSVCGEVVGNTCIANLQQGRNIGCSCNIGCMAKHWRHRRAEVVSKGAERGFEVRTTEEEWVDECDGNTYCPKLQCAKCKEVVTSTSIASIVKGSLGCECPHNTNSHLNKWANRRHELVSLGTTKGFEVLSSAADWKSHARGKWCPMLRCMSCGDTVSTTCIDNLVQQQAIGCRCNSTSARHFRHRRDEIVLLGKERGFLVLSNGNEWESCTGCNWCPKLQCELCNDIVTTTSLEHIVYDGRGAGCRCVSNHANHHRHRRDEVVKLGEELEFTILTTQYEWYEQCFGEYWCPVLHCNKCDTKVVSTSVQSLHHRHLGCSCHNKTEGKLRAWLEKTFSEATVNTQFRGPMTDCGGQTHFDFHLTFSDGFEVLIELDGAQHFWSDKKYYTNEGCERDLLKEDWAVAKGLSVVRVLQEDVWEDKLDWKGWLIKSIENARTGEARPITPDAPEYRSSKSAYVQLRPSCDPAAIC